MDGLLPRSVMDAIRRTAKSLKGFARRVFQAVVTNEHAEGKPRKVVADARACDIGRENDFGLGERQAEAYLPRGRFGVMSIS